MNHPPRILLFETSALLATLSLFTDHATYDPEALERLLEPPAPGTEPLLDHVYIPDHVIYELTGILPICFPAMLERFAQTKHDSQALAALIDLYALASPRGEVNDPEDNQKSHVRMLLRFVASHTPKHFTAADYMEKGHPVIARTETGRAYCERLKVDYAVLGGGKPAMEEYRPIFADALDYLGEAFKIDELRIHAGQLLMMGMISETVFNERIGRIESAESKQQRFYKLTEFLDKLEKIENGKSTHHKNGSVISSRQGFIPSDLVAYIKDKEAAGSYDEHNGYLKPRLFREYPQLLRLASERHYSANPSSIKPESLDDAQLFKAAFGPSHLLMEHYLHSGILPNTTTILFIAAEVLGLDVSGLRRDDDYATIKGALYGQGFYEISPTMAQLKRIQEGCRKLHVDIPVLNTFITALPSAERGATRRFANACKHPNDQGLAQQTELRMPHIGLPYEKVFGDALINGAVSWSEFQQLVRATNGLPIRYESYSGSPSGDILLKPSADAKQARILIAQDGFVGRTGKTEPKVYISRATNIISIGNRQRAYYDVSADALIERCRLGLGDRSVSSKLYRSFETMLYRSAAQDAPGLRDQAVKLLGEDRMVQLEKNFANRHARRSLQVQPPYRSVFAALHTNSRILRKNLGEVATFEAANNLMVQHPGAHIWIANHDSDLFCTPERDLQLEDSVIRQHAGLNLAIRKLNANAQGHPELHLVNSEQFLDSLHMLMSRPPKKHYEAVSAKPFILNHRSRSWAHLIDDSIPKMHQR